MRLTTTGIAIGVPSPVVGRITARAVADRQECVLLTDCGDGDFCGYRAIISASQSVRTEDTPAVVAVRHTDHLHDGDIVAISPKGLIRTVFLRGSAHNALFVTERCNNRCLMCSQPPKARVDDGVLLDICQKLIPLIPTDTPMLGITGGEPTLLGDDLVRLIDELKMRLPATCIHMLSNGRRFASGAFTGELARVAHPNLVLGIPLYADIASLHDYIVQHHGAFDETVIGLHELARWRIPVELRIVLHKLTIGRLVNWAEYVYRNLPFVAHIALMAMEPTGYAAYNHEKLWVDPMEYQQQLAESVEYLAIRGLNVSIYNLQRCILPTGLWQYARRSISDWKNEYLPECDECSQRCSCGGFFESAGRHNLAGIHALC